MTDAAPDNSAAPEDASNAALFGPRHLTRAMIAVMAVISCVIFKYGAELIGWPSELRYRGSLAQAPMSLGAFVVALVLLAVCAGIGTLALHRRYFMAGLMVATAGLTTWAARGGTMTSVLFNAINSGADRGVFLQMLVELVVFFAAIGGIWTALWGRRPAYLLKPAAVKEENRSTGAALIAQAALMAVFVLILVATPQKKQVLTGVFLAGLFATGIAENFFADRSAARWYWIAPLAAGAVGYLAGYFNPAGLEKGDLDGMFSPLTRVLPLDYASMGCAGVLMGYWWMMPEEDGTVEEEAGKAPVPASDSKSAGK